LVQANERCPLLVVECVILAALGTRKNKISANVNYQKCVDCSAYK
jgi:hypothetical protein